MEIKLFLRSLLQEYPDMPRGDKHLMKSNGTSRDSREICLWAYEQPHHDYWPHETPWPYKAFKQSSTGVNFILRKENFGGLLYDQTTAAVYKLDKEAYKVINHLQNGESSLHLHEKIKIPERKVTIFLSQLQSMDLL